MRWSSQFADYLKWSGEIANRAAKEKLAREIAGMVKDGDVIGAGSGSTSFLAIQAIGERIGRERLHCTAIPTSAEAELACIACGIPVTSLVAARPNWSFDGADEVDPGRNLIKGRGGAMFKEKLLIYASPKPYILVDQSKLVQKLGERFPIPVEVHQLGLTVAEAGLSRLGATEIVLRPAKGKDGPVVTENGNLILDVRFPEIGAATERDIKAIPGVVESGLFWGLPIETLVV
ncbi:MAG TPA: ribose 5-phosphate isomerase A [Candidatus Acidoferrales bacterium]|nr:ribose 5-phosphate isomerase A [Candidatus Acidoferrales bacterium]